MGEKGQGQSVPLPSGSPGLTDSTVHGSGLLGSGGGATDIGRATAAGSVAAGAGMSTGTASPGGASSLSSATSRVGAAPGSMGPASPGGGTGGPSATPSTPSGGEKGQTYTSGSERVSTAPPSGHPGSMATDRTLTSKEMEASERSVSGDEERMKPK